MEVGRKGRKWRAVLDESCWRGERWCEDKGPHGSLQGDFP